MINTPSLQELLAAGVHFGHQVRRGNPKMKQFIYGAREGVHIIDLTLSEKYLKQAVEYVFNLGQKGGVLLFLGTKKQARPIVEEAAKKAEAPYLTQKWIGGFLTNFDEIGKNIKRLKDLKDQREKGQLIRYTKKEQLLIDRRIIKLERDFSGALDLRTVPEAMFVIDAAREKTAILEARKRGVVIVAIADTNCDPTLIDYPIPGNDDAIKAITVLTESVANAYGEGKKSHADKALKDEQTKKEVEEKRVKDEAIAAELKEQVAKAEEEIEKKALAEAERKV